ncbi:MAG: delta-lactam-biosynthetic de-N-acetylase [Clostridia bacterium]
MSAVFIITVIVSANMVQTDEAVLASAEITNWGLSFQSEGQTPIGNATKEYLEQYDSYFVGDETEKKIYLTFDAGYENGYTENILDVLKKHDVSATFFLVGNYLETQADLVQRMVDEGHTVGNHTWSHPDMASISTEESFVEELEKVEEKFYEITGQEMLKLYRPPQGKFSEENLLIAQELGYSTVFWSLAYVDWYENEQPSQEEAFAKLIPRIHNGAIVLLHSTSQTNSEILDELLTKWEELGYEIASIEDLIV